MRWRLVGTVLVVAGSLLGCEEGRLDGGGDVVVVREDAGGDEGGPSDAGTDAALDAMPPADAAVDAAPDAGDEWPWEQTWPGLVFEGTAEAPSARIDLPIPGGATVQQLEVTYSLHIGVVEAGMRHQLDFTCADWRHPYRGGLFGFTFLVNELGSYVFRNGRPGDGAVDGPTRIPFGASSSTDLEIHLRWDAVAGSVTVTVTDPATGESAGVTSNEKVEPTFVESAVTLYLGYSIATTDEALNIGWRYSDLTVRAAP
jgi:hypothetical protein